MEGIGKKGKRIDPFEAYIRIKGLIENVN